MNGDEWTVGELFSGVAGFRLGLERAGGYKVVWANDNDRFACSIYRKHFGSGELVEGDIRDVKADAIPDIDLLCAGFPCPTFSIASSKRKGINESRGALFVQIARIASAKRPKFLLLENVRGLLSASGGRDFAVILRTLGGLGYILQWEVLNSKHYGVAQNRQRVFIVGCLGKRRFAEVFPIRQDVGSLGEAQPEAQGDGARVRGEDSQVVANTLSSRYGKDGSENIIQLNIDYGSQVNRIYSPEGLAPTIPTACGGSHIPKIVPTCVDDGNNGALRYVRTAEAKRVRAESMKKGKDFTPYGTVFRTLDRCFENVTGAITGALNKDTLVGQPQRPRMLTEVECERLQGFPDNWTEYGVGRDGKTVKISRTRRYQALGNAVTVNVVQFVAGRLRNVA